MDSTRQDAWLDGFALFEGLKPGAIDFIATRCEARTPEPGEVVFHQGDVGDGLFLVEAGAVEVIRDLGTEHETRLTVLQAPDLFGEIAILECRPRTATVRALDDCTIRVLHNEDLYDLFQEQPDQYAILLHRLARVMAQRLRREGAEFGFRERRDHPDR